MDLSSLGNLGDLAKQMQDAYEDGTAAMNQAGKEVAKDMDPDHEIEVNIELLAKVESHSYAVSAKITFEIELEPVLQAASSGGGDISSALEGLDIDLGDDKDAIMEQLGQPRAIGVVKKVDLKKLELHNDDGKIDAKLNEDGTLLATIKEKEVLVNFESVLSYPDHTDAYVAIPSMEMMQKNIVLKLDDLTKKVKFSWTEKDKDNLKVSGDIKISKMSS